LENGPRDVPPRTSTHVSNEKTLDHIAGYCLGVDMVVRGPEDRSFRKSIDGYAVLGPWMVTADEIENVEDIPLSLKVNDQLRQQCNTKDLVFGIRQLQLCRTRGFALLIGRRFRIVRTVPDLRSALACQASAGRPLGPRAGG